MKNKFRHFSYFYKYLGYRLWITFFVSLVVGLLDGFGLALFLPLLKLVTAGNSGNVSSEDPVSEIVIGFFGVQPTLINILGLMILFFSLKGIAKFLEGYIRIKYQQDFMSRIRYSNIDLLNTYDYKYFVKADVGRIQNTFTGEVGKVNLALRYYFKAFQYGVLVLVYVVMAFIADPLFSFLVISGGVLTNFLFKFLYKRTKMLSKELTAKNHTFQDLLIQKVAFFKYLKTTGLNYSFGEKLKRLVKLLERLQLRIGCIDAMLAALREPVVVLIIAAAIYLQAVYFSTATGLVILSLLLLYRAMTFFMSAQEQWNFFLGVSGSLENMEDFSEELLKGKENNGTKHFSEFKEQIDFRNVYFEYDEGEILHDVNLNIQKNETVALVGPSGSGKSTLIALLSGVLHPTKGAVLVDGSEISHFDLPTYKSHIGYVSQEVNIFNDTIYNNVTFWAEKTSENIRKFNAAVTKAAIQPFISGLTLKEETLLGNNGINLSGGQKQRLAIARELYKDVEILLMDEATSALDGETEATIQQNIENLKGKLTIVVIAHRLATIKHADKIVILKEGKVLDEGSYLALKERSFEFKEMTALQNL